MPNSLYDYPQTFSVDAQFEDLIYVMYDTDFTEINFHIKLGNMFYTISDLVIAFNFLNLFDLVAF